jgi:hypothetical protein
MINKASRELTWQFMTSNWQKLSQLFPKDTIARMCEGVTALAKEELLEQTRAFFAVNKVKPGQKLIDQFIEKQAVAVALKKREERTLKAF